MTIVAKFLLTSVANS